MATVQKRQANGLDTSNILDGPRKRRKESVPDGSNPGPTKSGGSPPLKITLKLRRGATDDAIDDAADPSSEEDLDDQDEYSPTNQPEAVRAKEVGLEMWNAVKSAKDPSGRAMAIDFLKLPSKRMYPDYYNFIKRPISLDEIKKNLESTSYSKPLDVMADFDTMFKNAQEYNMENSPIWNDAKNLHHLVSTRYRGLMGASVDIGDDDEDEDQDDTPTAGETQSRKLKESNKVNAPNMLRLIKQRLHKLLKKEDRDGRPYVGAFMELPSKREYPTYFKTIRKPMTFSMVDKKIDRKQYDAIDKFYEDVELIFSNAFTFNEEHSQVWNDAKYLQEHFRQLMSDLPAPLAIPGLVTPKLPTKVKLKVAKQETPRPASSTPAPQPPQPKPSPKKAPTPLPPAPAQANLPKLPQAQAAAAKSPAPPLGASSSAGPSHPSSSTAPKLQGSKQPPAVPATQPATSRPPATPSVLPPTSSTSAVAAPPLPGYPTYTPGSVPTIPHAQTLANYYYAMGYNYQSLPAGLQSQLPPQGQPHGPAGPQSPSLYPGQPGYPGAFQPPNFGYAYQPSVPINNPAIPAPVAPPVQKGYTPVHTPPTLTTPIPTTSNGIGSTSKAQAASAAKTIVVPVPIKYIKSLALRTSPRGRRLTFSTIEGIDLRFWSVRLGAAEAAVEFSLKLYVDPKATAAQAAAKLKAKSKASDNIMDVDDEDDESDGDEHEENEETAKGPTKVPDSTENLEIEVKANTVLVPSKSLPTPPTITPQASNSSQVKDSSSEPNTSTSGPSTAVNGKATVNGVEGHSDSSTDNEDSHHKDKDQEDAEGEDDEDIEDASEQTAASSKGKGRLRGRPRKPTRSSSNNVNSKPRTRSGAKASAMSTSPVATRPNKIHYPSAGLSRHDPRRWEVGLALGSNVIDIKVGGLEGETWRLFIERVL